MILLSLALSAIASLLMGQGSWTSFIHYLFYIALLLLMSGGSLFVLKGGMFDGIIYSFSRFYKKTSKLEEYVSQQTEGLRNPIIKKNSKRSFTYPLLLSGSVLFLYTIIASLM